MEKDGDDPVILVKTDKKAACGSMFRSVGLPGLRKKCPAIAKQVVTEWQKPTIAWMRIEGAWHREEVERGGAQ